jgi:hypothetical protein
MLTWTTENDFIKHEMSIWGEDEIYSLLDRGYVVKLTTRGYKWVIPVYSGRGLQGLTTGPAPATLAGRGRRR